MRGQDGPAPGRRDDVSQASPPRGASTRLAGDPEQGLEGRAAAEGAGGPSAHGLHPLPASTTTAQVSKPPCDSSRCAWVPRCAGRAALNLLALCALTLGVVLCTALSTAPALRIDLLPSSLAPSLSSSLSSAFAPLRDSGLMLSHKIVTLPHEGEETPLAPLAEADSPVTVTAQEQAGKDRVGQVLRVVSPFFQPSAGGGGALRGAEREGEGDRVVVFGDACGHSRTEVAEILLQAHGWEQEERRYHVSAEWVDVWGLMKRLERARPRVHYNESVCVLAALHGRVPCVARRCLVPLRLRPHFTDFMVLKQLLERGDFSFLHGYNFTTILDAGANVGFATLIFALQFPQATVVAVELSPDNYRVLKHNTRFLPNVIALNAGLHSTVQTLSFSQGGTGPREGWQYHLNSDKGTVTAHRKLSEDSSSQSQSHGERGNGNTKGRGGSLGSGNKGSGAGSKGDGDSQGSKGPAGSGAKGVPLGGEAQGVATQRGSLSEVPIKTITVDLILQLFGLPSFDFVKMDVEGSELEIFTEGEGYSPRSWLQEVQLLAIETHDRTKNGSSAAVQAAVKPFYKLLGTRVGEYRTWFDFTKVPHPLRHSWGGNGMWIEG